MKKISVGVSGNFIRSKNKCECCRDKEENIGYHNQIVENILRGELLNGDLKECK